MTEEWRPVEGFDGYEVSDLGRVRCWRPKPYSAQPPLEGRIVKPRLGTNGYLNVLLGFRSKTGQIHRLVAEEFVPGRVEGLEVAHENGDRLDNRAINLTWKTRRENIADKRKHGTHGRKLTYENIVEIRRLFDIEQLTRKEIADMFGITHGTVGKILRKAIWADVA